MNNALIPQRGEKMPVLFIGHGSPMNIIQSNPFTRSLASLGEVLPRPQAIMVISAHWLTRGTCVTCTEKPRMIYDFFGFLPELYRVTYECSGGSDYAKRLTEEVIRDGTIRCNSTWGLDHASYSVLRHIFPAADIPVFEMSLDYLFNDPHPGLVSSHYELGKRLKPLREMGVLIIGSGNLVHNLRLIDSSEREEASVTWAAEADEMIRSYLMKGDDDALIAYPDTGKWASHAIPTLDHYLPMIYTLALKEEGEPLRFIYEGFQNGSISMRSFWIG
ncbi:MAG: 4,5-DOPA dioxygenase extradiol [Methanospirillum sp.]|nr:4,5-DOPA dioxygenase extradiol [Methanospirillum sp.]